MAISDTEKIKIRNRINGTSAYIIPELNNLRRYFEKGEIKEITMGELRILANNTPGGYELLKNNFIINEKEAVEELLPEVEPEYYYTEDEIRELLVNGSLEQLEDCLDFAPRGVIELIKDIAVKEKLDNVSKRKAILKATDFNVTRAIQALEEANEIEENNEEKKSRRTTPIQIDENKNSIPKRRVVSTALK
jgi:hypothetical protein